MTYTTIHKSTLDFLKSVSKNNNRDWFNNNRQKYVDAHENIIAFTEALLKEIQKHDHLETTSAKESLMRIYRDTRFSKDKTPCKTHFSGGFKRATKNLRGGYYFQIGPGASIAAGGFFSPEPHDLLRIRKDIEINYSSWRRMLAAKKFKSTFTELKGEKLLTSPKGFPKDHPAIDLLRHKQFYFRHPFTDKEILGTDFLKQMNQAFKNLRPYFDYMSDILTTDMNGESIF
ncbi:MAG: DUF2461 domain-containing protein [Saprospiraceae bacterium]